MAPLPDHSCLTPSSYFFVAHPMATSAPAPHLPSISPFSRNFGLVLGLARAEGQPQLRYAQEKGLERYLGSSVRGGSEVDWDRKESRDRFTGELAADARRVLELARSTVYVQRQRALMPARDPRKRGPRTAYGDGELTEFIRGVLEASPWLGEGYGKVLAQLRARGIRTSRARVLRPMREANLLAPTRGGHARGPKAHDGTITTDLPDLQLLGP